MESTPEKQGELNAPISREEVIRKLRGMNLNDPGLIAMLNGEPQSSGEPFITKASESSKLIAMASGEAAKSTRPRKRKERDSQNTENPGPQEDSQDLIYSIRYLDRVLDYLQANEAVFARDRGGSYHVLIHGKRVPLDYAVDNYALAELLSDSCRATIWDRGIKPCIARLQVVAKKHASHFILRNFSALSLDQQRLYIPLKDLKILRITKSDICIVENGKNEDSYWIEPARLPNESGETFEYTPGSSLADFERLLVDTQACRIPEMRWLVAMGEGFFPFIKDICESRFIFMHRGSSTNGKTSGAQRFTYLLGLGKVLGNVSVATLNDLGDFGLAVMDNLEQYDLTQEFLNYFLLLSTGSRTGRAFSDGRTRGSSDRPVGVITSIEGGFRQEFNNRCVEVDYALSGPPLPRGAEAEILLVRESILSSMMPVLQRYFRIRGRERSPNPRPVYQEHFGALCDLLRAYGEVVGKPRGWSQHVINVWNATLNGRVNNNDDELEELIFQAIEERPLLFTEARIEYQGRKGTLYVTQCGRFQAALRELSPYNPIIPKNSSGLSARLRSTTFLNLSFLVEDTSPEVPYLKRTNGRRCMGFFTADTDVGCVTGK